MREAAAIGVPHEVKGEVAWVFACLLPGFEPSAELEADIGATVVRACSARRSPPVGS